MANPNIVGVTSILGNTSSKVANTTSDVFTPLVSNPASSGEVYKVNSILAANKNVESSVDVTVLVYPQDDLGGTGNALAHAITVPSQSTLIILDKSTSIYLKEDMSLGANATANNSIVITTSWEEISSSQVNK